MNKEKDQKLRQQKMKTNNNKDNKKMKMTKNKRRPKMKTTINEDDQKIKMTKNEDDQTEHSRQTIFKSFIRQDSC